MAEAMTRAGAEVVGATGSDEADITAWPADADPTLRLIAAVVAASAAEPSLNAWYDSAAGRRILHGHVDLGIAMDTPDGLFVPVLRGAEALSPQECRHRLEAMKAAVRDRSIAAADLKGQTITLSNFGTVAGHYAQLVVVPPQVAILGAGRIREAVRAVSGEAKVRRILPLSLSFDHRVVTGGEAGRFLAAVIAALERKA
jgi:pyruvate dehydrogenase E2 component (dihydrolipoamide acetyltransferase)